MSFLFLSLNIPKPYQRYIERYKTTAKLLHHTTGVPPSVQFAQAILESGGGRSNIAQDARNHFGLRCGDNWKGERHYTKSGCWRCYSSPVMSFADHAEFLCEYYPDAMGKNWEYYGSLKGYGGEGYWKEVVKVIRMYQLYLLD